VTRKELLELHDAVCSKAKQLMEKKNHDYSSDADPLMNLRRHGEFGVLVRMNDKLARLENFLANKKLKVEDESVMDTILDLCNYSILFLALHKEVKP